MKKDTVTISPDILSGTPVFKGTRVPVVTLFHHLEKGITLNEYLDDFPSVSKNQVVAILEIIEKLFSSKDFKKVYENID
jgi:uncharacterized protein (DUF433 family)